MQDYRQEFERAVWPLLRGAYNLARWVVSNKQDAEDVVQESFVKAFRTFDRFRGDDARSWFFTIVRNTALSHLQRARPKAEVEWDDNLPEPVDHQPGTERTLLERERRTRVRRAIEALPVEFREALVLRELEGLAYKEIAWVLKVPIGTVMSRLARARNLLIQKLMLEEEREATNHDMHGN